MASLRVLELTEEVPLKKSLQVDMDEWAVSGADPLATVGAGPCMNVVVHDPKANRGGLTHIWNVAYDRDNIDRKRSYQRHELYHKACFSVLEMIRMGIKTEGPFDVWLGAGGAFVEQSKYIKEDDVLFDFPDYIGRFLEEAKYTVTVTDNRGVKGSGDVVYWPSLSAVYFLGEMDNVFAVQTRQKAAVSGKCR